MFLVTQFIPLVLLLMTTLPGNNGMRTIYYDGNRPQPSEMIFSVAQSYTGIKLKHFEGMSDVNLCFNTFSGGIHSCSGYCGRWSDKSNDIACSCDTGCLLYNDCCPDYEILCVDGWQPETTIATNVVTSGTTNPTEEMTGSTVTLDINQTTTIKQTSTPTPWYVRRHNAFFDVMDLLRNNIPKTVENRPINENLNQTCFTPTVTPKFSHYMVATCPAESPVEDRVQCSNVSWDATESLIPVYSYSERLFYANKFCAACHGQKNESYLGFLTLSCKWSCRGDQSPYVQDAPKTFQECQNASCFSLKWLFDPSPRPCNPEVVRECPLINEPKARACQSYSAPVYDVDLQPRTTYKNVHCAYCNGANKTRNPCDGNSRYVPTNDHGESVVQGGTGQVPLTVLFDFSNGALQQSQTFGGPPDPLNCPEYFVYERHGHECRRVSCPPGAIFQQGKCMYTKDPFEIENRTLSGTLDPLYRRLVIELARKDENVTDEQILAELAFVWWYYENVDYYSIQQYNRSKIDGPEIDLDWDGQMWMKSKNIAPGEDCLANYTVGFTVTLEGKANSLYQNVEDGISQVENWIRGRPSCSPGFDLDFVLIRATYANFPYVSQLCNGSARIPKAYGERSFSREQVGYNNYKIEMDFSGNNTEIFESVKVPQEVIFTGGKRYLNDRNRIRGNWSRKERVYLCEGVTLCPLLTLKEQQYKWQFDSDDKAHLVLLKNGREVPHNEIILTHNGLVQICLFLDAYENNPFYVYSSGQSLATLIGCVISLTLLALVIITYCSFRSLRNVPGKTVLNLSISLFLAQLLLVGGAGQTTNAIVCLTVACVMHFFWLSVFSWTNILAFDLGRTFGKKSGMRNEDSSGSVFVKYSLYGWGAPLILVGTTIIVHFLQEVDGAMENIYGVVSSCWLRSGYPVLIAFGIPVALALVINVTYFTHTVLGIRSTMKMAKILKKDKDGDEDLTFLKKELYLYVRLSVSVGLTWISGFIIPYTGVAELGYLFIILNSLQGPVIFLSFTCSRRVMKLWSGRLGSSINSTNSINRSVGSSAVSKTMHTHVGRGGMYENNNV